MIILSAGHNARSHGASHGIYSEYPYTIGWIQKIHHNLSLTEEVDSVIIYPGRLDDKIQDVNDHVEFNDIIGFSSPTIAVELHFNAGGGKGCETLYYPGSFHGKNLAADFHSHFMKDHDLRDRGIKEGWYQMNPDKGPDAFLSRTKCTALILEPCFIEELNECVKIEDTICKNISDSLLSAYKNLL